MADPLSRSPARPREPLRELDPRDFPGCRAVQIPADELEDYEGRIEYWEARTATAMVAAEPTTTYHEAPSRGLSGLVREIALARGAEILALGSADLAQFDENGEPEVIMEADEIFFLSRPWPRAKAIDVDEGPLPDVVLEVDHTTDVRRRKLEVYASWRFPEVWVEVPEPSWLPPRTSGRPGLVIHVLEGSQYVEAASSRAFSGWTAAEIHRALNEEGRSPATVAAVRRVGRRMGRAAGTGPDDDLFLGAERAESRAEGWAEGRAEGRAEGKAEGRIEMVRALVRQTLAARGILISAALEAWLLRLDSASAASPLVMIATECRDADDFLQRACGA